MKREMPLQISDHVRTLGREAQAALGEQFARIDAIAEENTQKVLAAFQRHRVAESYFAGTTGYGYDDLGRDQLDAIFADLFGTEDALVRIGFVNGTHAISCALFGALKPGDTLVSAVGAPYDTLLGVIGVVDKGPGSLKQYGVNYRQVDVTPEDRPDVKGIVEAVKAPSVSTVLIQRSRGYATRASLSVDEIGTLCAAIRSANPGVNILVDNCYGEFVEEREPTQAGADLVVGSLIKNPGGGLAPQQLQVDDDVGGVPDQGFVMGDEEHGPGPGPEKILQKLEGLQIQVVGGLVQQQKVRLLPQEPGQLELHPLTAGQPPQGAVPAGQVRWEAQRPQKGGFLWRGES